MEVTALWDTGATGSVISQKIVDACGLKPIGTQKVYHALGEANMPVFLVNIRLPNAVEVPGTPVTLGVLEGADVLIGMDIIGMGDFAVTNWEGKTRFSFRTPSQGKIDFVAENRQSNMLSKHSAPSQQTRERNRRKRSGQK